MRQEIKNFDGGNFKDLFFYFGLYNFMFVAAELFFIFWWYMWVKDFE